MNKLVKKSILDWIYPPRCMSCRNPLPLQDSARRELWLCSYCENLFQPLEPPGCSICSATVNEGVTTCTSCYGKNFSFIHNRSAFAYEDLVRDMMHEIKFRRRRHVAQGLGRLWAKMLLAEPTTFPADAVLVPLPMHTKKRRERGFDQAMVMAEAISDITGVKLVNALERTHDTPPQSGLHPSQRIENVKGAFRLKPGNINGQTLVLVDDIYTTGASLNECARVLLSGGASSVYTITLAIALKQNANIVDPPTEACPANFSNPLKRGIAAPALRKGIIGTAITNTPNFTVS